MFGTLRLNVQSDDTQFIERITSPIDAEGNGEGLRYLACDKCRSKKVRLSACIYSCRCLIPRNNQIH